MNGVVASVDVTDAAKDAGIGVDSSVATAPKITFTEGSVKAGDTGLVSGGAVATVTDGLSGRLDAAEATITSLTETGGVVDSIQSDIEALAGSTGRVTEAEKKISEIETSLSTGAIHEEIDAVKQTANNAKTTADTAVQSASGDTYVTLDKSGTTITATTNIAQIDSTLMGTAMSVGSAISNIKKTAATSAEGDTYVSASQSGTKITVSTDIGAIDEKLVEESSKVGAAIKAAQTAGEDAADALSSTEIAESSVSESGIVVTLGGTVGAPSISGSVTISTYTAATAEKAGYWSNETNVTTGADVARAIADVNNKIDTLHSAAVTYKVFAILPTAAAEHKGVVALVPAADGDSAVAGSYVEYLCVETDGEGGAKSYSWERIGTTAADFTQYAKSVTVNGTTVEVATATGDINIGKVVSSVADGTVTGTISTTGELTLTIDDATTSQKGAVQLTDTYSATDSSKAVTGKAVADALDTIDTGVATINDKKGDITIKDGRETVYESDLWGTSVTTSEEGVITVDHKKLAHEGRRCWNSAVNSVEDNKAYGSDGAVIANIQTDMIKDGSYMFYQSDIASFDGDLSSLTKAEYMFYQCNKLTSFEGDLSSLTNGRSMFYNSHLETFEGDLSSLTDGASMFAYTYITSIASDLGSLTDGGYMFYDSRLKSFCGDLSSLTNGDRMFYGTELASFCGDLSSLEGGRFMFYGTRLASFCGDLSSLTKAENMFWGCKLDTESVECVAETINTTDKRRMINIGINNAEPNAEEHAAFALIHSKGWELYVDGFDEAYVPATGEATLDETGETTVAPKPYWAKPVEVTEEKAQFVGEDGKFYQVIGGQFIFVSDPDTYGMFTSREDAIANMRLTKYEKPTEETEAPTEEA